MDITDSKISLDITKLREQRRPLWMSPLGITSFAEMVGAGGDIYSDRLVPEWPRYNGEELSEQDAKEFQKHESKLSEDVQFGPNNAQDSVVEEAFRYVHEFDKGKSKK